MKPRIKLVRRDPVFRAKKWRCDGFSYGGYRYATGYGWSPQQAYFEWKNALIINYLSR